MASGLYNIQASREMATIDAVVSQSPLVIEGNKPRLDESFCLQIAGIYKEKFYRQDMKEHSQPYSAPTIKVRAAPGTQIALEDNVGQLWRDWLNDNIRFKEEAKAKMHRINTPGRRLIIAAITLLPAIATGFELGGIYNPQNIAIVAGVGIVMFVLGKYVNYRVVTKSVEIGKLDMYHAMLNTRMRVIDN